MHLTRRVQLSYRLAASEFRRLRPSHRRRPPWKLLLQLAALDLLVVGIMVPLPLRRVHNHVSARGAVGVELRPVARPVGASVARRRQLLRPRVGRGASSPAAQEEEDAAGDEDADEDEHADDDAGDGAARNA